MVSKLQRLVEMKDKQIQAHDKRIDDQEQYGKIDNMIIHGLKTRHRVFSRQITPHYEDIHGENALHEEFEYL